MERSEIREQVLDLLKRFTRKLSPSFVIADALSLTNDLNINSADLVELVLEMEERFDIQVPDSALGQLTTVGQVIDLVEQDLTRVNRTRL